MDSAKQFFWLGVIADAHGRTGAEGALIYPRRQTHLAGALDEISVPILTVMSSFTGMAQVASALSQRPHRHLQPQEYRRRRRHIRLGNYGDLEARWLAIHRAQGMPRNSDRSQLQRFGPRPAMYLSVGIGPSRVLRRSVDRQMNQLGKRARSDLLHGGGTVGLDSPLADAQDVSDLFIRIALDNHLNNLPFAQSQARHPFRGGLTQR